MTGGSSKRSIEALLLRAEKALRSARLLLERGEHRREAYHGRQKLYDQVKRRRNLILLLKDYASRPS